MSEGFKEGISVITSPCQYNIECQSPNSIHSNSDENILASNVQTPKLAVLQRRDSSKRKSQTNAQTSFMSFFYIGRFVEKLSLNRKRLGSLNEAHFNLIGDKASDAQNLFTYSKRVSQSGINLKRMKTLFERDAEVRDSTTLEQVKEDLKRLRKPIVHCINTIIHKIPIIQPESLFKMYWDFFTSIFRIILLILVPLEIAFKPEILFNNLISITYVILMILQLDFLIRINTLTYRNGIAIKDKWELVIHQLKKEFLADFSTSLILIIFMIIPDMKTKANLFLLLILAQHKYVYETFANSDQISYLTRPQRGIFGLLKFILTLLYILHLFSCIWFYFSSISIEDSWIRFNDLEDKNWEEQYLEALYFAVVTMLTIGYGDMVPKNAIEKIVTMVFVLGACLWVSYSVNFIGSIIDDITQNQVERNRRMRVINKYMNQRKIPYSLQHQVKEYLTFRWKEDDEVDLEIEQTLLEQLSDELKEELDKQAHKVYIEKSEFLQKYFSEELRNALFKSIKRKIIPPQNTFSTEFGNQQHLCFVEQGFIVYQHPERKQRSKMNAVINQGQFFCVNNFITNNPQVDLFKAIGYASLLVLSKSDFIETLKDFPEDFQKYCQLKDNITLSYAPPTLENGVFCPACQNFKHPLNRCPQVQYVPNREAVIKKYCMTENQRQNKKYPRQNKIISDWVTWADKDLASQYASVFQNENQQAIAMQSKIQLNFEYGSDTNSSVDDAASPGIKIPQNSPIFQAQHIKQTRKSRIVQDPQFQSKADSRQNLNLALQNRKQSILTAGISLGFGRNNTPKNKIEIPLVDEIKESDSSESSSGSEESTEKQEEIDYQKLVEKRAQATQDFNDNMTDNITNLYHQLQTLLELNENDVIAKKALQQFEPLYWQFNQQKFDDFETKSQFDYYFNKQNAEDVILLMKEDIFGWQTNILDRMRKFMLYPFQYVLNFLKLRRNAKLKFVPPLKMVAKIKSTLDNLKKALKRKAESTVVRSSLKFNSVAPDANKTQGKQRKWVV
ncbi:unnamed protein product (macronuclear) [Paramecium tetraurelia]|uniref:Potassium channel domain-containing protein n=1 Tax=Paramecium tetraurelia TaxID=5888 RepID=A0EEI4_PARTE|nr:uncharacterized protein GSPATT00026047001 [Paramecium tetraurelia]CAK93714.1 unnamed protein product [Paramecium tetraurelia]|eukprot:XP_001461098.1 hypothetical protein (macronuclear) [Paramecium tetraurelia strain d4-2]